MPGELCPGQAGGHRLAARDPSDGMSHHEGKGSRSRWPLALRAKSPVSLAAQLWGGWVASVVGFSRPGCVLVGSQGVSQLQESCNGKRNSRDAERRKCEVRPLKDFISKGGEQRWKVCVFDEVEQSG